MVKVKFWVNVISQVKFKVKLWVKVKVMSKVNVSVWLYVSLGFARGSSVYSVAGAVYRINSVVYTDHRPRQDFKQTSSAS